MSYTEAVGAEIVGLYADGFTLEEIEARDGMPCRSTIRKWLVAVPAFSAAFERARGAHADSLVGEVKRIADTELDPNRARVRIDARRWIASKLRPDTYGDKLDLNVTGRVDISAALMEARNRLARPVCDQPLTIDAECEEVRAIPGDSASDRVSPDQAHPLENQAPPADEVDIFG